MNDAAEPVITKKTLAHAEKLLGLTFTDAERELMLEGLNRRLDALRSLRSLTLDPAVPPAVQFDPRLPGMAPDTQQQPLRASRVASLQRPENLEDVAFYPVTKLAQLLRTRQLTSSELTTMYLKRLKRFDPHLKCVVTLTEERALAQAKQADAQIAAGNYRGPLHGIPWGAKDLIAVQGYPTTWGAMPYKDQVIDLDATVVQRLDAAGAVLVAKLTSGALAYGDVWFGGTTKSPWNLEDGASGSSAGPASATAGGLVGFSIGSETLGSIVSPSTRCGTTGLRPSYGRVSRFGVMALSWSMDKLGPICRAVEDCALVFDAIRGSDGKDSSAIDLPFNWDAAKPVSQLQVGYVKSAFEEEHDAKDFDEASLAALKALGVDPIAIELPQLPEHGYEALRLVLVAEAAAAFDELTRSDRDDLLVRQDKDAWPNIFRMARLMPAVEYIQANRVRVLLMQQMAELMKRIDVYVCPSFGANTLILTNLTGHPAVVLPNGFSKQGTPAGSLTFTGNLYAEANALRLAKAYQDATGFHEKRPEMAYAAED